MDMEELLDMLGSETRREMLRLLSERPCYVSELAEELEIGQKAIIEHLEIMREAGILEARVQRIEKGRPRKYYEISRGVILEVTIAPDHFAVETLVPEIDEEILEAFPNLRRITEELDEALQLEGRDKTEALKLIYKELQKEDENLSNAKKVVEYLSSRIKEEIKK